MQKLFLCRILTGMEVKNGILYMVENFWAYKLRNFLSSHIRMWTAMASSEQIHEQLIKHRIRPQNANTENSGLVMIAFCLCIQYVTCHFINQIIVIISFAMEYTVCQASQLHLQCWQNERIQLLHCVMCKNERQRCECN